MASTDFSVLRTTTEELQTRFHGLSREDVVALTEWAKTLHWRQATGKVVRGVLGWLTVIAGASTAIGILAGLLHKVF